jgi:hypothetical protein
MGKVKVGVSQINEHKPQSHTPNIAIGNEVLNKNGGCNFQPFAFPLLRLNKMSMNGQSPTSDISNLFIFCTNHLRYKSYIRTTFPIFYIGFVMESYTGFVTILYKIFNGQICLCMPR